MRDTIRQRGADQRCRDHDQTKNRYEFPMRRPPLQDEGSKWGYEIRKPLEVSSVLEISTSTKGQQLTNPVVPMAARPR